MLDFIKLIFDLYISFLVSLDIPAFGVPIVLVLAGCIVQTVWRMVSREY